MEIMDEMLKLLGNNPVFADLSMEELEYLSAIIEYKTFNSGDIVFDTHEAPRFLYLIESGSFTLKLSNNNYKTLVPGDLIGEIGVINGDFRSGVVSAIETSNAISICGVRLFEKEIIPSVVALKIVRALSKRITGYLRSLEQISTLELIRKGENHSVEFKSTLRWNLFTNKKDKAIEKAALKTMAAFMNSNGGMLIIGVTDEGSILGLDTDQFASRDKLLLHLTGIIKERIGSIHLKYLQFSIEKIANREILRIDCLPAAAPAYLRDGNSEHLFIRSGPSTTDLQISKVYDYIAARFY